VTVAECLAYLGRELADGGVTDARIEAEVLLRHALGVDRGGLYTNLRQRLPAPDEDTANLLLGRRLAGEPLAYLVGHREFYGLDFIVEPGVLIPRQETELLVDTALELAAGRDEEEVRIADVGTGSGAIAVAIATQLPRARVYATDVSEAALRVAAANVRRHGVSGTVSLCSGDLLAALPEAVDVIVSNPPYISTARMGVLAAEIRREPARALDGGEDGLSLTRRLLEEAPDRLRRGGSLVVEIDAEQLDDVRWAAAVAMPGATVSFRRDLMALPRAVVATAP
jgi:release factor glutamine methyltransferase